MEFGFSFSKGVMSLDQATQVKTSEILGEGEEGEGGKSRGPEIRKVATGTGLAYLWFSQVPNSTSLRSTLRSIYSAGIINRFIPY